MKIHAISQLSKYTGCGLKISDRLSKGESRITQRKHGNPIHVSTLWLDRGHNDVSCKSCLKAML